MKLRRNTVTALGLALMTAAAGLVPGASAGPAGT